MPKIKYRHKKLGEDKRATIAQANTILAEYAHQGIELSLRGLYYQFVSRGFIENNVKEYKKLGDAIADGRLAGLIDWNAIVDHGRYLRHLPHWDSPAGIIESCAAQFRVDKWAAQPHYLEVMVEKDALLGVIRGVCEENDVPYSTGRGYSSMSEVWRMATQRIKPRMEEGKSVTILYLGDHDPSGIDMTNDLQARLTEFACVEDPDDILHFQTVDVKRIALNYDQVETYNPPPNVTKAGDKRSKKYEEQFGTECWELDALNPITIRDLIQTEIDLVLDADIWETSKQREVRGRQQLAVVAEKWDTVCKRLKIE